MAGPTSQILIQEVKIKTQESVFLTKYPDHIFKTNALKMIDGTQVAEAGIIYLEI